MKVTNIADTEPQPIGAVPIHDFVGRCRNLLECKPHFMLLRLVSRKDHNLPREAHLATEQSTHERLSERTRPPGDDHPLICKHKLPRSRFEFRLGLVQVPTTYC